MCSHMVIEIDALDEQISPVFGQIHRNEEIFAASFAKKCVSGLFARSNSKLEEV